MSASATAAPTSSSNQRPRADKHDDAICDYLLSDRGCVKGDACDFKHPTAPNGSKTNHVCQYFGSVRGCLKAEACPYLHPIRYNPQGEPATRVCDFYLTAQGCAKSFSCDYLHPKAVPAIYNMGQSGKGLDSLGIVRRGGVPSKASSSTERTCKYIDTEEGCRQGDACKFVHPGSSTDKSASSSTRKPNVLRGGVGSRGASIVPSIRKLPKQCQYYSTKEGCKKGDLCDFIHMRDRPCQYFKEGTCKKGNACNFVHSKE